jgi:two-component system phosphate regulon sensor histidine kinase PhoR
MLRCQQPRYFHPFPRKEQTMRKAETSEMLYSDTARMEALPIHLVDDGQGASQLPSEFESVLLAIAGHDLRQPLQAIQCVHDLFGSRERSESELRVLRYGQTAIDRLNDQLDQILNALRP